MWPNVLRPSVQKQARQLSRRTIGGIIRDHACSAILHLAVVSGCAGRDVDLRGRDVAADGPGAGRRKLMEAGIILLGLGLGLLGGSALAAFFWAAKSGQF